MKGITGTTDKKDKGAEAKVKNGAVKITLASLVGKTYAIMPKAEQEKFIICLGQMLDVLDATGKVKTL